MEKREAWGRTYAACKEIIAQIAILRDVVPKSAGLDEAIRNIDTGVTEIKSEAILQALSMGA